MDASFVGVIFSVFNLDKHTNVGPLSTSLGWLACGNSEFTKIKPASNGWTWGLVHLWALCVELQRRRPVVKLAFWQCFHRIIKFTDKWGQLHIKIPNRIEFSFEFSFLYIYNNSPATLPKPELQNWTLRLRLGLCRVSRLASAFAPKGF